MQFYMTDDEILASYRQAKYPRRQIGVLADLNACKTDEIRQHLMELGALAAPRRTGHELKFERAAALALYKRGYNDCAIARALGVSNTAIRRWRCDLNLPKNRTRGR